MESLSELVTDLKVLSLLMISAFSSGIQLSGANVCLKKLTESNDFSNEIVKSSLISLLLTTTILVMRQIQMKLIT